jgi:hypothetical protein
MHRYNSLILSLRRSVPLPVSVTLIEEKKSLWKVISSSVVDRCPHRSEIQSVALAEGEGAVFNI